MHMYSVLSVCCVVLQCVAVSYSVVALYTGKKQSALSACCSVTIYREETIGFVCMLQCVAV